MADIGHFGCPNFTFDRISGHFRSIGHFKFPKFTFDRNSGNFRSLDFFFGGHFGCLKITLDRISGHFRLIGHFGCQKYAFDGISGHFRSIQNFFFFFKFWTKWPPAAILDGTTMSIIELVRDICMSNACVKFEERSLNPSKVIAPTTKLWRGGCGCVDDENIIFPKTSVSREYNYLL